MTGDTWKYIKTNTIQSENDMGTMLDCLQCGLPAMASTKIELTYNHSQHTLTYILIECVGDHSRFPVPLEWFEEHILRDAP